MKSSPNSKETMLPGRSSKHENIWCNDNISPEGFSLDFPGWFFGESRFIF